MTMPSTKKVKIKLASNLNEIDRVCPLALDLLTRCGLQRFHFAIELVARELLNNAILHGNKQNPDKQVEFNLFVGRRWIRLQIADQGDGFNWRQARRLPPDVLAESGRGMAIARVYGQRVHFGAGGRKIEVWFDQHISIESDNSC